MPVDLPLYTLVHVLLSVLGLLTGLVALGGWMAGALLPGWTALFLATTVLTTLTGFGFPFTGVLPSHVVGVLSLIALPVAQLALYGKHLAGGWCTVFVLSATLALYLNVFVLVAQLFQKIPVLAALAPTPQAPAFGISQLLVLVVLAVLARAAVKGLRQYQPLSRA